MTKKTPPEYGLSPGPIIVACVYTDCLSIQQQTQGEMSLKMEDRSMSALKG